MLQNNGKNTDGVKSNTLRYAISFRQDFHIHAFQLI